MRLPVLMLFALALVGCQGRGADRFVGHWAVDLRKSKLPAAMTNPGPMKGMVHSLLSGVEMKLRPDGTAIIIGGTATPGIWTAEGSGVTVSLQRRFGEKAGSFPESLAFEVAPNNEDIQCAWPIPGMGKVQLTFVRTG